MWMHYVACQPENGCNALSMNLNVNSAGVARKLANTGMFLANGAG